MELLHSIKKKTRLTWLLPLAAGAGSLALLPDSAAAMLLEAACVVGEMHIGELAAQAGALALIP
jgi:hypothetical protein